MELVLLGVGVVVVTVGAIVLNHYISRKDGDECPEESESDDFALL